MTRDEVREKRQNGVEIEKDNGEGHQVENDADKKPDRFIILAKSADILGDWRTPLRMIQTHELMEPASSTSVQTIITDVWNGHQVKGQGSCIPFLTCVSFSKVQVYDERYWKHHYIGAIWLLYTHGFLR